MAATSIGAPKAPVQAALHMPHELGALSMSDGTVYEVSIIYRDEQGNIIDAPRDQGLCLFTQNGNATQLVTSRLQMIAETHAKAKNIDFKNISTISIKEEGISFDGAEIISHDVVVPSDLNDLHKTTYTKVSSIWSDTKDKLVEDYEHHLQTRDEASISLPVQFTVQNARPEAELRKPTLGDPNPKGPVANRREADATHEPPAEEEKALPAFSQRSLKKALAAATKPNQPAVEDSEEEEEEDDDDVVQPEEQPSQGTIPWLVESTKTAVNAGLSWVRPGPAKPHEFTETAPTNSLEKTKEEFKNLLMEKQKGQTQTIERHFASIFSDHQNEYDTYYEEGNPFHIPASKVKEKVVELLDNKTPRQVIEIFSTLKQEVRSYTIKSGKVSDEFVAFITHIIETELEQYIKKYLFVDAKDGPIKKKISLKKLHALLKLSKENGLLTHLELPNLDEFLTSVNQRGNQNLWNTAIYKSFIEPVITEIRLKLEGQSVASALNWRDYLIKD